MKSGWSFFWGLVVGVVLTIIFVCIIGLAMSGNRKSSFTKAEEQTEFTAGTQFEVFQVLSDGALAYCEDKGYSVSTFTGPIVYILADGQNQFYDKQIIKVPKGKKAIQIGTYSYHAGVLDHVVPVIVFK